MTKLACRTCGRQVYTAAPAVSGAGDRRCPRCGAPLDADRRGDDRRQAVRRADPPLIAGPPAGIAERRFAERRKGPRRRADDAGWQPR